LPSHSSALGRGASQTIFPPMQRIFPGQPPSLQEEVAISSSMVPSQSSSKLLQISVLGRGAVQLDQSLAELLSLGVKLQLSCPTPQIVAQGRVRFSSILELQLLSLPSQISTVGAGALHSVLPPMQMVWPIQPFLLQDSPLIPSSILPLQSSSMLLHVSVLTLGAVQSTQSFSLLPSLLN
jgi:hypothetical protein